MVMITGFFEAFSKTLNYLVMLLHFKPRKEISTNKRYKYAELTKHAAIPNSDFDLFCISSPSWSRVTGSAPTLFLLQLALCVLHPDWPRPRHSIHCYSHGAAVPQLLCQAHRTQPSLRHSEGHSGPSGHQAPRPLPAGRGPEQDCRGPEDPEF